MGKKYEDEIREILKGFDDPDARRGSRRPPPTPVRGRGETVRPPRSLSLRSINPQQVMAFALILWLFAFVMQGPWARGFPDIYRLAGYISVAGTILFVVALISMLRAGGRFAGLRQQQRWRGQVVYLPNRQPFWVRWRHSLSRLFRPRRPRR